MKFAQAPHPLHLLRALSIGAILSAIHLANAPNFIHVRKLEQPGEVPAASTEPGAKKDIHQHWRETGLAFDELKVRATNPVCHASPENFLGCVAMVNSLVNVVKLEARLLPGDRVLELQDRLGETLFLAGPARVVKTVPRSKRSSSDSFTREDWSRRRAERAATLESWMRIYESGRRVDFEALSEWFRSTQLRAAKAEVESEATGAGLNAFFAYVYDPHTHLVPRAFLEQQAVASAEEYSGIGIYGDKMGERFVVRQPIEGGPALRVGLRAGDVITHIDGEPIQGLARDVIVDRIKGPTGSLVRLGLSRRGRKLELSVPRERIQLDNVTSRIVAGEGKTEGSVALVKLAGFDKHDACIQVRGHLEQRLREGARSVILDLRGNPGGYVEQAVCVASLFLEKDQPVVSMRSTTETQRDGAPVEVVHRASGAKITDAPLVVLLDASSASSSELVAGALRDHGRALVVGERSFGKGSVQTAESFGEKLLLYKTIMRFYQPGGSTNQLTGIHPDIAALETPSMREEDRLALREEDLYPNAMPAVAAPAAESRERIAVVAQARRCVETTGKAARRFHRLSRSGREAFAPDYPVLVAQDALACATNALATGPQMAQLSPHEHDERRSRSR